MRQLNKPSFSTGVVLLAVVITAIILLYNSPQEASALRVVPDSVEYAIGAWHLVHDGSYYIVLDGRQYPSRYPPWFSALFISPAYLLAGDEIGNAIYPVLISGIAGVILAYLLAFRISGAWGGLVACIILLALPSYRFYSREVMSDIPATAIVMAACLLYSRSKTVVCSRLPIFLLAGLFVAVAAALRPVLIAIILPFAVEILRRRTQFRAMLVILLCLPTAMLLGATWAYNLTIFGSATRTGYHFWCPVPYDYPKLTFSALYLWGNLMTSFLAGLIPLALVVLTLWVAARNRESSDRSDAYARTNTMAVLEFFVLGTLPGVLFYLVYFFSDKRFFLPPLSLLAVLAGGGLGSWLSRFSMSILSVCAILLIAISLCIRLSTTSAKSQRRLVADRIMTVTPPNALVISSVDPAYLEFMLCRASDRRIVPTSRVVEYASKFVAPKRIDNPVPAPSNCRDHRCAGIKNGGAREVFNQVASESMELLASAISSGRPVYLDTSYCLEEEKSVIADLRMRFQFIERASHLQQLVPITPHSPIE